MSEHSNFNMMSAVGIAHDVVRELPSDYAGAYKLCKKC